MKVLVLGAGPSGLMAAHAAATLGHDVTIFDRHPRPMDGINAGVFYLHSACGLPIDGQVIRTFGTHGTARDYARKLYGDPDVPVSFPEKPYESVAFDGMEAMFLLWEKYNKLVQVVNVRHWGSVELCCKRYAAVVSTIPLPALLPHLEWLVRLVPIRIYNDTFHSYTGDFVHYNADADTPWYRRSILFGRWCDEFVEHTALKPEPSHTVRYVQKVVPSQNVPQSGDPDLPSNLLLAGRYGAWDKSQLVHTVYRQVVDWLG